MYTQLFEGLSALARCLIPLNKENFYFWNNPDNPAEHQPNWHEFGIITHSIKALNHFQYSLASLIYDCKCLQQIQLYLLQNINNISRYELLSIAIILHDLGKFKRTSKFKEGILAPNYSGHEKISEQLILNNNIVFSILRYLQYDRTQINYIAKCTGLHFELGKLRNQFIQKKEYNFSFLSSNIFKETCNAIIYKIPDFKFEIGIMFLCDSLAKTDFDLEAKSDSDIEQDLPRYMTEEIIRKNLPSIFIKAIKQKPVNIEMSRKYLSQVINTIT